MHVIRPLSRAWPERVTAGITSIPLAEPPDARRGPRIAPGPSLCARDAQRVSTRVYMLSAPYWKMPIDASVGSPASLKVTGPE